jgi:carbon monoxide dehydrogenase subunit G
LKLAEPVTILAALVRKSRIHNENPGSHRDVEFGGHYLLSAGRLEVWRALNDTRVLKAAIPGCRTLVWSGPEALELEIAVNLGVAHPVFSGSLVLTDIVPALSYTLNGRGKGGLFGAAHGSADVSLADHAAGTELRFLAHGGASNRLMQIGRALIGHSAQRVIDGFFEGFAEAMGTSISPLLPEP